MIAYTSYKHSVTRFTLIIVADVYLFIFLIYFQLLELFFHSYVMDCFFFFKFESLSDK